MHVGTPPLNGTLPHLIVYIHAIQNRNCYSIVVECGSFLYKKYTYVMVCLRGTHILCRTTKFGLYGTIRKASNCAAKIGVAQHKNNFWCYMSVPNPNVPNANVLIVTVLNLDMSMCHGAESSYEPNSNTPKCLIVDLIRCRTLSNGPNRQIVELTPPNWLLSN
jgi:hypothetical protein